MATNIPNDMHLETVLGTMSKEDRQMLNERLYGNLIYHVDDPISTANWLRAENMGWTDVRIIEDMIVGAINENLYETSMCRHLVNHLVNFTSEAA